MRRAVSGLVIVGIIRADGGRCEGRVRKCRQWLVMFTNRLVLMMLLAWQRVALVVAVAHS